MLTFCLSEDRQNLEPGLRLAIGSIRRHCPNSQVVLYMAAPTSEFSEWLQRFPEVTIVHHAPPGGSVWNCKPHALLPLLREGRREVVWLDSDVLLAADPRECLTTGSDAELVVCEEYRGAPDPGSEIRTRAWNLPIGRRFPRTLNSAVLRVTTIHIPLLKRWAELLEDPRYQHWQTQDFSQRPIHCWSDQDALTALMGSQEFAHVNVRILKTGRNVIHCLSYTSFPVSERLGCLLGDRPTFVHAQGEKPWVLLRPEVRTHLSRRRSLLQEVSPYRLLARGFRDSLGSDDQWLWGGSFIGRTLCCLGLGHFALVGLPSAALAALAKCFR